MHYHAAIGIVPFFLTDLKQIIGARIGLGIFEAVIMTVATAMIGDYYKGAAREKWIGIQVAAVSVSAIFLIAIGGALGDAIGSRKASQSSVDRGHSKGCRHAKCHDEK